MDKHNVWSLDFMIKGSKVLMKKMAIFVFLIITIALTNKEVKDYSKWLVNDFNSNYLKDRIHHYFRPIIEEKFLLDSIIKRLPPSSDTTYLMFYRSWCSEYELIGLNRFKSFDFKYSEMTKDSFKFKKNYSLNGIRRNKYFEIKNIKSTINRSKVIDIFQNRDTFAIIDNPPYCMLQRTRLMSYWIDSSNNFRYSFYNYKIINGSIKLLQLSPNDTMITKERTNKIYRVRF